MALAPKKESGGPRGPRKTAKKKSSKKQRTGGPKPSEGQRKSYGNQRAALRNWGGTSQPGGDHQQKVGGGKVQGVHPPYSVNRGVPQPLVRGVNKAPAPKVKKS